MKRRKQNIRKIANNYVNLLILSCHINCFKKCWTSSKWSKHIWRTKKNSSNKQTNEKKSAIWIADNLNAVWCWICLSFNDNRDSQKSALERPVRPGRIEKCAKNTEGGLIHVRYSDSMRWYNVSLSQLTTSK